MEFSGGEAKKIDVVGKKSFLLGVLQCCMGMGVQPGLDGWLCPQWEMRLVEIQATIRKWHKEMDFSQFQLVR